MLVVYYLLRANFEVLKKPIIKPSISCKLDRLIDFAFIYKETKEYYCHHNGRPSIDPVILVKYLLVDYLYGIESERRIEQEIQVNMAYR